jgi:hypothetical protein
MNDRGGRREGAGRPKGTPNKATREQKVRLSDLARMHCDSAMAALVNILENGQSESARIAAAIAILDRGYGRPLNANPTQMMPTQEDPFAGLLEDFL